MSGRPVVTDDDVALDRVLVELGRAGLADRARVDAAHGFTCPTCAAQPRRDCINPLSGKPTNTHPLRVAVAEHAASLTTVLVALDTPTQRNKGRAAVYWQPRMQQVLTSPGAWVPLATVADDCRTCTTPDATSTWIAREYRSAVATRPALGDGLADVRLARTHVGIVGCTPPARCASRPPGEWRAPRKPRGPRPSVPRPGRAAWDATISRIVAGAGRIVTVDVDAHHGRAGSWRRSLAAAASRAGLRIVTGLHDGQPTARMRSPGAAGSSVPDGADSRDRTPAAPTGRTVADLG